ncbi:hypothetical protein HK405_015553, partial [Cladochytrium tenue]
RHQLCPPRDGHPRLAVRWRDEEGYLHCHALPHASRRRLVAALVRQRGPATCRFSLACP